MNRCVQCHRPVSECDETCVAYRVRRHRPLTAPERKRVARRLVEEGFRMSEVELTRVRMNASLDQWISQVREEQAAGMVGAEPENIYVRLGQLCGIPSKSTQPQDIKAQPVLMMLAFAMHRLLKETPP